MWNESIDTVAKRLLCDLFISLICSAETKPACWNEFWIVWSVTCFQTSFKKQISFRIFICVVKIIIFKTCTLEWASGNQLSKTLLSPTILDEWFCTVYKNDCVGYLLLLCLSFMEILLKLLNTNLITQDPFLHCIKFYFIIDCHEIYLLFFYICILILFYLHNFRWCGIRKDFQCAAFPFSCILWPCCCSLWLLLESWLFCLLTKTRGFKGKTQKKIITSCPCFISPFQ